ncbi:hypothetical protein ACTWJ8_31535 [Streptomyces sp. SDT5-1]|uniref:hypothetical protein n=1 Tax=Streptomyces sp. SDT5-1 TaxID=3406418 RepID=UPI003FD09A5C
MKRKEAGPGHRCVRLGRPFHQAGARPRRCQGAARKDLSEAAIDGKVDVLIDIVGGQILRDALTLVCPRGRTALLGHTDGRELTLDLADFSSPTSPSCRSI